MDSARRIFRARRFGTSPWRGTASTAPVAGLHQDEFDRACQAQACFVFRAPLQFCTNLISAQATYPPLNKGRSLNSGDTLDSGMEPFIGNIAQRRPEPELRRHSRGRHGIRPPVRSLNEGRSLNSGDTVRRIGHAAGRGLRSTKAGA